MAPLRLVGGEPLTPEERRMVLRITAVIVTPFALIVVVALMAGFLVYKNGADERAAKNTAIARQAGEAAAQAKQLAVRLASERTAREQAIARAVFQECVANEAQDAVVVAQLQNSIAALLTRPPSAVRDDLIRGMRDGVIALEPPGEPDCKIPGGKR